MPISNQTLMRTAARFVGTTALAAAAAAAITTSAFAQTTLRFATTLPPTNAVIVKCIEPHFNALNEVADGEFNIEYIYGPTIANPVNVWERVADGVVDIGWGIHGTVNLPFPKTTVAGLPLLLKGDKLGEGAVALMRLYDSGLIADEYQGVKPIMLAPTPVQGLSLREPIHSLEEVKGLKLRAADRSSAAIVTALGGSPISVGATEVYQAISQGVISGSIANSIIVTVFRLGEVSKFHIVDIPLGAPTAFIVMNPDAYERLSDEGKEIFDAGTDEEFSRAVGECFSEFGDQLAAGLRGQEGQTFITLDPAEQARWEDALGTVTEDWINETPDGQAVYDAFKAAIEQ